MIKSRLDSNGNLFFAEGMKYIDLRAFKGREDIKKIFFPSSLEEVGEESFSGCRNLEEVIFPEGSKCFRILKKAFFGCCLLKKINFPLSLREVREESFSFCSSLEKVEFLDNVFLIENKAFFNCKRLLSVSIRQKKATIEKNAFLFCQGVKLLVIGTEKYKCFASWEGFFVALTQEKKETELLIAVKTFDGYENGALIGFDAYCCIGDSGYIGEGVTKEDAIRDYLFLTNEEITETELNDIFSKGIITMPQFRKITKACFFGCEVLSCEYNIGPEGLSIKKAYELAEKYKKNKMANNLLKFFKLGGYEGQ